VTSSYHMPRALAELATSFRMCRSFRFRSCPKSCARSLWSSSATAKLLLSEYVKYIVARVRMQLDSPAGSDSSRLSDARQP